MINFYNNYFVKNNSTPSAKAHCSCLCSVLKIQSALYNTGVSGVQSTDNKFNSYTSFILNRTAARLQRTLFNTFKIFYEKHIYNYL